MHWASTPELQCCTPQSEVPAKKPSSKVIWWANSCTCVCVCVCVCARARARARARVYVSVCACVYVRVLVIVCRSTCKVFRPVLLFPFSQVTCTCNTQHTSQHRTQVTWKTSHYGPLWSETWEDRRWRGRSKVLAHGTLARGCGGSRERESCCWEATWQYRFVQGRKGIEVQEPAGMKKKTVKRIWTNIRVSCKKKEKLIQICNKN